MKDRFYDNSRCSLVKALKGVLERIAVENTIYTNIGYPLRQEQELIDSIAIREAVVNAIVHNDYSFGATPKIEFFFDRVEITSMGGLPYGIEEEDFFAGCSVPRNKEIMRVFRDLEIVEHLGSGVPRILSRYGREVFEIRKNSVRVVLPYVKPIAHFGKQAQVEAQVEAQVLRTCEKQELSSIEIAHALGHKTLSGNLRKLLPHLRAMGLLDYTIPNKPKSRLQKYKITEKGVSFLNKETNRDLQ